MEQVFLKKLTEIVEANIGDSRFGVDELVREMGMSRSNLFRKLHAVKGISINQFIRETRLRNALEILQKEEITVAEVAYRTGFGSPGYFNTCFHGYYGYPPGEAKKMGFPDGDGVRDVKEDTEVTLADKPIIRKTLIGKWLKVSSGIVMLVVLALIFNSIYWNTRPEKTIAVLPFENLRQDTALQPWITGLELQLHNDLAKIMVFKVKARVSADKLRAGNKSMSEIGSDLKADYLIKGTFDKLGDSVKIWIQVIKARTGDAYLPETYTLKMNDFFNLQTEIARDIAGKLNTALSPEEKKEIEKKPTQNQEAYRNYQLGVYYADRKRGLSVDIPVEFFRKAIELDPRFALAYARIALAKIWQIRVYPDYSEETYRECKTAIDQALEIDPDLPAARNALGNYYWINFDYDKALQEFERIIKSHPDDVEALYSLGTLFRIKGDWGKAVKTIEKAMNLDPLNAPYCYELGRTFLMMRDYAQAERHFKRALEIEPAFVMSDHGLVDVEIGGKGNTIKAREILENAARWNPGFSKGNTFDGARFIYQRVIINLYEGKYAEALEQISQIAPDRISIAPPYNSLFQTRYWYFSIIYGLMNKPDSERSYYDSSRIYIETGMPPRAKENPSVICGLGIVYAGLGNAAKAIELGEKATNLLPITKNAYGGIFVAEGLAHIYVMVGKYQDALKILDQLLSLPGPLSTRILVMDPRWAPLKNLPGYKKLLNKYSIP